jgi:D-alanyl-D-alanine carboxypeptidase
MKRFGTCGTAIVLLIAVGMAGTGCGSDSRSASDALDADIAPALASWRAAPDPATGVPLPGTAVAVYSPAVRGTVTYTAGVTDLASGKPLAANDTFRLASITKMFTAGLVMKLDQEGKLAISDPISKYVTWPNGENITIEMLLSHTSGIPNELAAAPPGVDPNRDYSPRELLQFFADYGQPDFAPGTQFMYSNTGYRILGEIIETVTGTSYAQAVKSFITDPLKLTNTYLWGYQQGQAPVQGYNLTCTDGGRQVNREACIGKPSTATLVTSSLDWKEGWSAGSLVSDAHDVSVYTHALIAGDFLDAAHRARMQTPNPLATSYVLANSGSSDQPLKSFGLGLEEYRIDGIGTAWGHNGEIDGFHNTSAYFVDAGFGLTVLDNLMPAGPLQSAAGLRELAPVVHASLSGG